MINYMTVRINAPSYTMWLFAEYNPSSYEIKEEKA